MQTKKSFFFFFTFLNVFLLASPLWASQQYFGKVVQLQGAVEVTSLATGQKFRPRKGDDISSDAKISTGKNAFIEIVLQDGLHLWIKDHSLVNIANLKRSENSIPAKVLILKGKIRLKAHYQYQSRGLIIKTPTALIGTNKIDLGLVVTKRETRLLCFTGTCDVANRSQKSNKGYTLIAKEETSIVDANFPTKPQKVPTAQLRNWFKRFSLKDTNGLILMKNQEYKLLDKLILDKGL